MKRRKLILFSLLAAFIMLIYGISYAVSPTRQARIVAEEELPKLKELVGDRYQDFHFASREELAKAYLGEPIPSYKIHNFDSNKSIVEQMEQASFYVFPVMVDGKAVTDVPVVLQDQEWAVVDIGGHLSRVIQNVKLNYKLTEIKVLKFYEERIVLGKKDNKLVGFLPYRGSRELGIEKGELVKSEKIKKLIEKQKKDVEIRQQKYEETGKIHYGASSTTAIIRLSKNQFVNKASVIIAGRVISSEVQADFQGLPVTDYKIKVDQVFKGDPGAEVEVRTARSEDKEIKSSVEEGMVTFELGEEVTLFLTDEKGDRPDKDDFGYFVVGQSQGKLIAEKGQLKNNKFTFDQSDFAEELKEIEEKIKKRK